MRRSQDDDRVPHRGLRVTSHRSTRRHLRRERAHGSRRADRATRRPPLPRPQTLTVLLDALPVRYTDGHRLWTVRVSGDGYAQVTRGGRTRYVHRLVWEAAHGPIEDPELTLT